MTKRLFKGNITRRKHKNRKTKKQIKKIKTIKNKYGGERNIELVEQQKQKNLFRRALNNFIIQIKNKKNIKQAVNFIIKLFDKNIMINTLIPVTENGKPVDKETYNASKTPINDFVSPVSVILNNLSGVLPETDIIRILNAYYEGGGNFNMLSSRFKITPFEDQVNKKNVKNVKLLLNKEYKFHIIEDGLNEETKKKLAELIPNEQQIINQQEVVNGENENVLQPEAVQINEPVINEPVINEAVINEPVINKLVLPYQLPENNEIGYNRNEAPEFWKPIFQNGQELLNIRDSFMRIYENDKYRDNNQKRIIICDILERIIPGYSTKYSLLPGELVKTVVNVNILNCFITLLYGIILYKLFDTKQDYLFIFKGGRAIQISLTGIKDIMKYVSEDADLLVIPNPSENSTYNLEKMENLACHIGYLVKWMIPEEINVILSLPTNPKNTNKDITKLVYNDGRIFKALSDIGFGEIPEDIKEYFSNFIYSPIYVEEFAETSLFITPTIDDMLSEKLFFYIKYYYFKKKLEANEPITDKKYSTLTIDECNYYLFKFQKAILKLIEAIINKEYIDTQDFNRKEAGKLTMRGILSGFEDYSNEQKENIVGVFNL